MVQAVLATGSGSWSGTAPGASRSNNCICPIRASAASSAICCVNRRVAKIRDCSFEAFRQPHLRLPAQHSPGETDVRLALLGIVHGQRLEDERAARAGQLQDPGGEIADSELAGIPDIDRSGEVVISRHQPRHGFDKIVDVAEASRLRAVPVDGDVVAEQRLHDEVGDDPDRRLGCMRGP